MTVLPRVVAALALAVDCWLLLAALARRLPPGLAREVAGFLPNCAVLLRRLWRAPEVPRRTRVVLGFAALWVLSPVDLVPEFLPVIGPLDDVIVVVLALRYALRTVPREVVEAAWPGSPAVLGRLLGDPKYGSAVTGHTARGDGRGAGRPPGSHRRKETRCWRS